VACVLAHVPAGRGRALALALAGRVKVGSKCVLRKGRADQLELRLAWALERLKVAACDRLEPATKMTSLLRPDNLAAGSALRLAKTTTLTPAALQSSRRLAVLVRVVDMNLLTARPACEPAWHGADAWLRGACSGRGVVSG
jgi:hypothetical protein